MLKKLFGGIKWTWLRLILFAVICGVVTGLIALWVPDGSSFRQIAVTFEAWIVLAIVVVVNCEKPLEAACKTFVFFLISQPLVYLVQAPFHWMGLGLFKYYYPYWFYWTLLTFPGAFIAWFIKRDDWIAAVILSVALAALILLGVGYLKTTVTAFPKYLISTLFCLGMVPVLILMILHRKRPRWIAALLSVTALAAILFFTFRDGLGGKGYTLSIGLNSDNYPVTEEWTARMEDPENGTASLMIPEDEVVSPSLWVEVRNIERSTAVILTDPEGNEYIVPLTITKDGNGIVVSY